MAYLLDTNVFIQARDGYYGFDVCPGFWRWLDDSHKRGVWLSIKAVRDEILAREDDLARWCKARKGCFIDAGDGDTYESLKLLSSWVSAKYAQAAQAEFLGCADFILVGYAHAHGHLVVTHEVPSSGFAVKIPNACKEMDVGFLTPLQMLSREGVQFVLKTS